MKLYFKNLDGIRFLAALFVLLQHSFGFKQGYSDAPSFLEACFAHAGVIGVNLFFILSGFLISYLLLVEKDTTGTVSYKKFYMRRILRIWPLYLGYGLILALVSPYVSGMLGLGNDVDLYKTVLNLIFLILFSVNIQLAFVGDNKGIFEISWSVCVEEQFYLIWPVVINNFRKKLLGLIIVMVCISIIMRIVLCFILPGYIPSWTFKNAAVINYLLIFDKLDLFGGGLGIAILFYNKDKYQLLFRKLFHPVLQAIMLLLSVLYILSIIRPENQMFVLFGDHLVCMVLFGYMLLSAVVDNSILNLEYPLLRTLGRISFGIYLFHTAVCQIVLVFFKSYIKHPESRLIYDIGYPLCNTILTCTIAYISYEYYEKWFLKKKNKFALVQTRV